MTDYTSLRTKLEAEHHRIVQDLTQIAIYNETTGDWEAIPDTDELKESDENSEADGVEEWNERRATTATLETIFRNITLAVKKIETGTYGLCEICEEPIEPERLEFLPTARTCVSHMNDERTLSL